MKDSNIFIQKCQDNELGLLLSVCSSQFYCTIDMIMIYIPMVVFKFHIITIEVVFKIVSYFLPANMKTYIIYNYLKILPT
jgi:hypothetical protein